MAAAAFSNSRQIYLERTGSLKYQITFIKEVIRNGYALKYRSPEFSFSCETGKDFFLISVLNTT
jgi:hypothetical protein